MQKIEMTMDDFDRLMETLEEIDMDNDGYIPSEDDLMDYIERHPERYYLYLLWYSEHKPAPKNENEKKILKKITAIINRTVQIVDNTDQKEGDEE